MKIREMKSVRRFPVDKATPMQIQLFYPDFSTESLTADLKAPPSNVDVIAIATLELDELVKLNMKGAWVTIHGER